jgi:hypothetical protein
VKKCSGQTYNLSKSLEATNMKKKLDITFHKNYNTSIESGLKTRTGKPRKTLKGLILASEQIIKFKTLFGRSRRRYILNKQFMYLSIAWDNVYE